MGLFGDRAARQVIDGLVAWNQREDLDMQWTRTRDPGGHEALAMAAPEPFYFLIRAKNGEVDIVFGSPQMGSQQVAFTIGGYQSAPGSLMRSAITKIRQLARDMLDEDGDLYLGWILTGWTSMTAKSMRDWRTVTDIACTELSYIMEQRQGPEATAELLTSMLVYDLSPSDSDRIKDRVRELS